MPDSSAQASTKPYFDLQGMATFGRVVGEDYDPNLPEAHWWKDTREKLYHLVSLLSDALKIPFKVNYKQRPKGQGGPGRFVFIDYVIAGFCPAEFNEGSILFIKLAFHELDIVPALDIEVDIDTKVQGNRFVNVRPRNFNSRHRILVDDAFPKDWASLIEQIAPVVMDKYRDFCAIAGIPTKAQIELQERMQNLSINTILYGPPGTGKTFKLQKEFMPAFTSDGTTAANLEEHFRDTANRLYWWEIVAAILYELNRPVTVAEIAAHPLALAKQLGPSTSAPQYIHTALRERADAASSDLDARYRRSEVLFTKPATYQWTLSDRAYLEATYPNLTKVLVAQSLLNSSAKTTIKHYRFITFHQKYSYEDFVVGIRPVLAGAESTEGDDLKFERKMGIFYECCLAALRLAKPEWKSFDDCYLASKEEREAAFAAIISDPSKQHALFIDEINRANISAVFGELITLIEEDKRIGRANELWVELPYDAGHFCVPPNLYLIGTMNTADKSIALLDIALRRRFEFKGMYPDYAKAGGWEMAMRQLNEAIYAEKRSADFLLGHAFFMKDGEARPMDDNNRQDIFNRKIVPLLTEYFNGKAEKVREVLNRAAIAHDDPSLDNNYQIVVR